MQLLLPEIERYRHVCFEGKQREEPRPTRRREPMFGPWPARPRPAADPPVSPIELGFTNYILARGRINPVRYRGHSLARRIPACLRALRCKSIDDAVQRLETDDAMLPVALDSLLIGVTQFFRDHEVFSNIGEKVLPDLLRRSSALTIWSAGCSDGSEIYSLAMMLAEKGALHGVRLIATDCRPSAIEHAQRGQFSEAALDHLPAGLRDKYFLKERSQWRIARDLSSRIEWHVSDIFEWSPVGPCDLILCRNMAIYLDHVAADLLWHRLTRRLVAGGYLVGGRAETPSRSTGLFRASPCIFVKPGASA